MTYHILPHPKGGWSLKTSSSKRVLKKFSTQKEAISNAKNRAKDKKSVLYIHGKNGLIRESRSYDGDSLPPKDYRPLGEAKGKVKVSEDFDEEYSSNS